MKSTSTDQNLELHLKATHCHLNNLAIFKRNPDGEEELDFLNEELCLDLYKKHQSILFFDDESRPCFLMTLNKLLGEIKGDEEFIKLEVGSLKILYLITSNKIALTFIDPWALYDSLDWDQIKKEFDEVKLPCEISNRTEEYYKKYFLLDHLLFKCLDILPGNNLTGFFSTLFTLFKMAGLHSKIYSDLTSILGVGSKYCLATGFELQEYGYFSGDDAYRSFTKPDGKSLLPKLLALNDCNFLCLRSAIDDFIEKFQKLIESIQSNSENGPMSSEYRPERLRNDVEKFLVDEDQLVSLMSNRTISETGEITNLASFKASLDAYLSKPYSQITFICREADIRNRIKESIQNEKIQALYKQREEERLLEFFENHPEAKNYSKSALEIERLKDRVQKRLPNL